jgi:hypothetical protein
MGMLKKSGKKTNPEPHKKGAAPAPGSRGNVPLASSSLAPPNSHLNQKGASKDPAPDDRLPKTFAIADEVKG